MSLEVAKADKAPLEEDSDYQKAFTQVHMASSPLFSNRHICFLNLPAF